MFGCGVLAENAIDINACILNHGVVHHVPFKDPGDGTRFEVKIDQMLASGPHEDGGIEDVLVGVLGLQPATDLLHAGSGIEAVIQHKYGAALPDVALEVFHALTAGQQPVFQEAGHIGEGQVQVKCQEICRKKTASGNADDYIDVCRHFVQVSDDSCIQVGNCPVMHMEKQVAGCRTFHSANTGMSVGSHPACNRFMSLVH